MSSRDIIIFFSLSFFWAMSFIFYRIGVPEFGSIAFSGLRIIFAGLTMSIFLITNKHYVNEIKNHWKIMFLLGIISTAVPFTIFSIAAKDVHAGVLAVINASIPMLSGVVASVFFNEKLTLKQIIGLLLGMLGVILLMSEHIFYLPSSSGVIPMSLALFACIGYAIGVNVTRHHLESVSPIAITSGAMIIAALAMLPITLYSYPYGQHISIQSWLSVICIGVVSTALAMIFMNQLIKRVGAVKATCTALVIPVFAIVLGYILLGEALDLMAVVGSVVILTGTYLSLNLSIRQILSSDT